MSRGYPDVGARRVATRATSVALSYQRAQPSLARLALGGGFKIPAPPSGAVLGAAIALAIGYAYRWYSSREGDAPTGKGLEKLPGGTIVNQDLTFIETRQASGWDAYGAYAYASDGYFKDGQVSSYGSLTGAFFNPAKVGRVLKTAPPPTQHYKLPLTVTSVPNNWYIGYTREARRYWYINPTTNYYDYRHKIDIWRNETGVATPPLVEAPPETLYTVPVAPNTWKPSRPILIWTPSAPGQQATTVETFDRPDKELEQNPPLYIPDDIVTVPERGVGFYPETGAPAIPMTPGPELKLSGSPGIVQLINKTIGQFGEAIDVTRCFMYATGNTYKTKSGLEKTIPKWRWREALIGLSNKSGRPINFSPKRERGYSVNRDGNILTASGDILTPTDVAARLAQCLVVNELTDRMIAAQSKILSAMGKDLGLTVGPLGVQSIFQAATGNAPYEGVYDFNI